MDNLEIAKALFGSSRGTAGNSKSGGQTTTAYGIATSDSVNGSVRVNLGGDTVSTDDDQTIEVDTTFAVYEGDEVIVSLVGADGTGKSPIVIGVVGRGDEQQAQINSVINYVWDDDRGLHVSTQERSVQGANILLDADSLEIRNGNSNSESDQTVYASFGREITVGTRDVNSDVGTYSQVYGQDCVASAPFSKASGFNTIAASQYQTVEGRNNVEDSADLYAFIIGNGTAPMGTESFQTDGVTSTFSLSDTQVNITDIYGYLNGYSTTNILGTSLQNYITIDTRNGKYWQVHVLQDLLSSVVVEVSTTFADGYTQTITETVQKSGGYGYWGRVNGQGEYVDISSVNYARARFTNYPLRSYMSLSGYDVTISDFPTELDGLDIQIVYTYEGSISRSNGFAVDWAGNTYAAGEYKTPFGTAMIINLLWENASPSSNFSAQHIPLSLQDYSLVCIAAVVTTSGTNETYFFAKVGGGTTLSVPNIASTQYFYKRDADAIGSGNQGVTFSTGYRNTTGTTGANYCIPTKIYGIKFS